MVIFTNYKNKIKNRKKQYEDFLSECETGFKNKTMTEEDFNKIVEKYEIPDFNDIDSGFYIKETIEHIIEEFEKLLK
jgi:hypothetical protein